jgi:hypothetical protein
MMLIAAAPPLTIGYPKDKLRQTAVIMNMRVSRGGGTRPVRPGVCKPPRTRVVLWAAAASVAATALTAGDEHSRDPRSVPGYGSVRPRLVASADER